MVKYFIRDENGNYSYNLCKDHIALKKVMNKKIQVWRHEQVVMAYERKKTI